MQDELDDLLQSVPKRRGVQRTPAPARPSPSGVWTPDAAQKVKDFYRSKFGRDLPVSAQGQSRTHDRMNLDHSHAFDIPLHPESEEGRAVVDFMRQNKYPYLAYSQAVPGQATGPHIHGGLPSRSKAISDQLDTLIAEVPPLAEAQTPPLARPALTTPAALSGVESGSATGQLFARAPAAPPQTAPVAPPLTLQRPSVSAPAPVPTYESPEAASLALTRSYGERRGLKGEFLEKYLEDVGSQIGHGLRQDGKPISPEAFAALREGGFDEAALRSGHKQLADTWLNQQSMREIAEDLKRKQAGADEQRVAGIDDAIYSEAMERQPTSASLLRRPRTVNWNDPESVRAARLEDEKESQDAAVTFTPEDEQYVKGLQDYYEDPLARSLSAPVKGFAGDFAAKVGNVLREAGKAIDSETVKGVGDYLRRRGAASQQAAQYTPAEAKGTWGEVPVDVTRGLVRAGLDIGQLIALKRATGANLPSILVGESLVRNLDKDAKTQQDEAVKAAAFGAYLEKTGVLAPVLSGVAGAGQEVAQGLYEGKRGKELIAPAIVGGATGYAFGNRRAEKLARPAVEVAPYAEQKSRLDEALRRQPIEARREPVRPEPTIDELPDVPVSTPDYARPVFKAKRYMHARKGLVQEAESQKGAGEGRVIVNPVREDGSVDTSEVYRIQRPNGRGDNNRLAVPVREGTDATVEAVQKRDAGRGIAETRPLAEADSAQVRAGDSQRLPTTPAAVPDGIAPQYGKEQTPDAQEVRSNPRPAEGRGQERQGSETGRGGDVQQAARPQRAPGDREVPRGQEAIAPPVTVTPEARPAVPDREAFKALSQKAFRLSPDQSEGFTQLVEARARAWAKENGRNADEYIPERFAGVVGGGATEGAALYQGGTARGGDGADVAPAVDGVVRAASRRGPQRPPSGLASTAGLGRNFSAWFKGSKVVDQNKNPLVVYHGTNVAFDAFDPARAGENTEKPHNEIGFFFTPNADEAATYTGKYSGRETKGEGANIVPVHLNIKKPYRIDYYRLDEMMPGEVRELKRDLESRGYDGLLVRNPNLHPGSDTWYVAFRPEQIKSAIGNRGTFDPDNPNILLQDKKAATEFLADSRAIIRGFQKADVSSAAHEFAHVFRRDLSPELLSDAEAAIGVKDGKWQTEHEEKFARGFERYLKTGEAPDVRLRRVFASFKLWLTEIYGAVMGKNHPLKFKPNPELVAVFDRALGGAPKGEHGQFIHRLYKESPAGHPPVLANREVRAALGLTPIGADAPMSEVSKAMQETADAIVRQQGRVRSSNIHPEMLERWARQNRLGEDVVAAIREAKAGAAEAKVPNDNLRRYNELVAASDKEYELATKANRARDREAFEAHTRRAYEIMDEAKPIFERMTPEEKSRVRGEAARKMGEGLIRGLVGEPFKAEEAATPLDAFTSDPASVKILESFYEGKLSEGRFRSAAGRAGLDVAEIDAITKDARAHRESTPDSGQGVPGGAAGEVPRPSGRGRQGDVGVLYQGGGNDKSGAGASSDGSARSGLGEGVGRGRPQQRGQEDIQRTLAGAEAKAPSAVIKSPEFKRWFGRSKVRDENGEPLVVYHGTNADFDVFDKGRVDKTWEGVGFFFTDDAEFQSAYGDKTKKVFLSLQNPKILSTPEEWSKFTYNPKMYHASHDGVIYRGETERGEKYNVYVAFEPTQIKSVDNQGTFDPSNPNILYQTAPSEIAERARLAAAKAKQSAPPLQRPRVAKVTPPAEAEPLKRPTRLEQAADVLNLPRTLKSSIDLSAAGRQGLKFATTHPRQAIKIFFGDQMRALRQDGFDKFKERLASDPDAKLMDDSGLYLASRAEDKPSEREEAFASKFAQKIPLVGASNRAYVAFLDAARSAWFKQLARATETKAKDEGRDISEEDYKRVANFVNIATGRGNLGKGKINDALPLLNAVFFAPRYTVSRLQAVNPVMYAKLPKGARKMAVRQAVQHYSTLVGVMALAKYGADNLGITVESEDPTSADFGKVKAGNTRYDLSAGDLQYVNLAARLFDHFEKKGRGENQDKAALDLIKRWARYKLAPIPSAVVSLDAGKDAVGRETSIGKEVVGLVAPIYLNDLWEAYKEEGAGGMLKETPGFLGVGVNTYKARPATRAARPTAPARPPRPQRPTR